MEDIFKDIEAAADLVEEDKSIDLGAITRLVSQQEKLERDASESNVKMLLLLTRGKNMSIDDLEEALKARKKDLFDVRQIQIPELMKEFGLKSITTSAGTTIEVKGDVSVSVKDEGAFFKYLREHNAADLIKKQIVVSLENEEEKKEVVETLNNTCCSFEEKESVHSQTLKKYVKGLQAKGVQVPDTILNIYEYQFSKIKK